MTVFSTIYIIVIIICASAQYAILYKEMLRFNIYVTIAIMTLAFAAEEMAGLSISPVCNNSVIITLIYLASVVAGVLLIQTDKIIDMLIIDCLYLITYNILGTIMVVLMTVGYGAIKGTDATTWFAYASSTDSDMVMRSIATLLAFVISIIICRKCMSLILNADMKLKLPLVFGTAIPMVGFVSVRMLADLDSDQMLEGSAVICYGVLLLIVLISLFTFFINVFLTTKEENELAQIKIDEQDKQYQRVLKMQQELREVKHDLVNQLVAAKLSKHTPPPKNLTDNYKFIG